MRLSLCEAYSRVVSESFLVDGREKNLLIKVAKLVAAENWGKEERDVKQAMAMFVKVLTKEPGPFDLERLNTNYFFRAYTGDALDEMLTDWILLAYKHGPGRRENLSIEEKEMLKKLYLKWEKVTSKLSDRSKAIKKHSEKGQDFKSQDPARKDFSFGKD
jgi:hypothetical protein